MSSNFIHTDLFSYVFIDASKIRYFERQFELADALKLPMFLHMRAAAEDFCNILIQQKHRWTCLVMQIQT